MNTYMFQSLSWMNLENVFIILSLFTPTKLLIQKKEEMKTIDLNVTKFFYLHCSVQYLICDEFNKLFLEQLVLFWYHFDTIEVPQF